MAECERRSIVTTRKEHRCYNCNGVIPAGEMALEFFAVVRELGGLVYGHACGYCGFLWDYTTKPTRFLWTHGYKTRDDFKAECDY